MSDACIRCGGGIEDDHPTTCGPCRYEQATGRSWERDVEKGIAPRRHTPRPLALGGALTWGGK